MAWRKTSSTREHLPSNERFRELLVGRKIIKAEIIDDPPGGGHPGPTGWLTLDDGTQLKIWANVGGCSCGDGDYRITDLNYCDNIITNVEMNKEVISTENYRVIQRYSLFVFAENKQINLASFEGSDGDGYYGTGFWIDVIDPTSSA